jgi:hypothetical protein
VFQHIPDRAEIERYVYETVRLLSPTGIALHQFRLGGFRILLHQLAADFIRIPTRMPKFHRHWRGLRFDMPEIERLAHEVVVGRTWDIFVDRPHAYLIIGQLT